MLQGVKINMKRPQNMCLTIFKTFCRFKQSDIPGSVMKGAPDFCSVYVISKGKPQSSRAATRPAPAISPLRNQVRNQANSLKSEPHVYPPNNMKGMLV